MKIAITCPASIPATPFGGILIVAVNLAKKLAEKGHDATIYTTDLNFSGTEIIFDGTLSKNEKIDGFTIKRSHVILKSFMYFVNPGIFFQLKNDKPDIIHVVGIRSFQAFIAALISKFYKIPLIVSDYGGLTTHPEIHKGKIIKRMLYKLQKPMLKFIMNKAVCAIAANEYEFKDFSNLITPKKIRIIKNGIDFELLQKPTLDFKKKYNLECRLILFVGRFNEVKGIDLLLKSFSLICQEKNFTDVNLVIMGSNFGFHSNMMNLIKILKINHRVLIIENPPRDEVIAAYHACEFLVLPSRWELSPLTPLEGFACKKTTISTNISGIPFVIDDKKTGILVDPESVNKLTSAILKLLVDKKLSKELGEAGFKVVSEKLNSKIMVNEILETYDSIQSRHHN